MSYGVYSNLESFEGSLNGSETKELARKSRQIVLTNDSGSADLQYKFNASETYATLKPTETLSVHVHVRNVYLNSGSSVAYRLWVFG